MIAGGMHEVEPASLRKIRNWVRQNVPGVSEAADRRGFQLLQWTPSRSNGTGKQSELSLEHEARLKPVNHEIFQSLLGNLHQSEGLRVGECLLPHNNRFGSLVVRRYKRDVGPQSVDRYYDVLNSSRMALISRMITVRERIMDSSFMTWGATSNSMCPLNIELPFIALGDAGMTVRLEFNWIDNLAECLNEAVSAGSEKYLKLRNPMFIAATNENFELAGLAAVLEHTTFREKFGFQKAATNNTPPEEVFVLNVDHVIAQCLRTGRIGSYIDVDISGVKAVDEKELAAVNEFAQCISDAYSLQPNLATKALRDAQVTGLT